MKVIVKEKEEIIKEMKHAEELIREAQNILWKLPSKIEAEVMEGRGENMTQKEKLIKLMDNLMSFAERACLENAKPEEIAVLPAVVDSITRLTNYASFGTK